jgi:putative peptidoglycan lipid II flippase
MKSEQSNGTASPAAASHVASTSRSITIATLIMMGSVLLSRVIGLIREIILARYGGTSFEMDAYVTAFIVPELLNHFLAGGFLSITFIPIFQKHLIASREKEAWESFSNLISIGSLVFLILIPVTILFTPNVLRLLGPHIRNPENFSLTVKLTRIILPAQLFFYWGAFFNAAQMSYKRFFLPALAPLGYNGGIILGGIILGPRLGIEGFAWGVLAGAIIGNVLIQLPGAIRCGMRFTFRFNLSHPDVRQYIVKTIPLVLGLGMSFSNEIFFRFFGSFLPEGGTSSVNYALRTTMMVVAVFGQASGVAFYPFLSTLAAERKFAEMGALLGKVLNNIALYLFPLSAVLFVNASSIISILYERGKFTPQSRMETAKVFSIYLLGTFFFSGSMIIARSFYALQKMIFPMAVSTAIAAGTIPLYLYFSAHFGARGIAIAAICGMACQYFTLLVVWTKQYGASSEEFSRMFTIVKIVVITCAGAAAGYFLRSRLMNSLQISPMILKHMLVTAIVSLPMLAFSFFLYDRAGIQSFSASIRGLTSRK